MLQPSKRQLDTSISAKTSDLWVFLLVHADCKRVHVGHVQGIIPLLFFKTEKKSKKLNIEIKQLTRRV